MPKKSSRPKGEREPELPLFSELAAESSPASIAPSPELASDSESDFVELSSSPSRIDATTPNQEGAPPFSAPSTANIDPNHPAYQQALNILRQGGATQIRPGNPTLTAPDADGDSVARLSEAPDLLPARMLNEFVYCPRLFYYEHVEGIFVDNADTVRGKAIHKRVDAGKGQLPSALKTTASPTPESDRAEGHSDAPEIIHSRSVSLGSQRLGVVAKLDLCEIHLQAASPRVAAIRPETVADSTRASGNELDGTPGRPNARSAVEVVPVDYKAGAPREGTEANELWPTDEMQLGLQILLLRDNGYACNEGVIYYRATKQRVRFELTPEREAWVLENIAAARRTVSGPIPPPLVASPKCRRCSLAPVCLPDETRLLASDPDLESTPTSDAPLRRLLAARDDSRALYLNTPGLRVGRKEETLTIKAEDALIEEVRLKDVSHVALFGNIQLTTQAIQGLCDAEIPITYFSSGGWFYGLTRGHGLKNVFLRIQQFRLASEPSTALRLARAFVHGKIRNHRTLLMRNHTELPAPTAHRLREAAQDALNAASIEQLLGIEGAAAAAYFEQFQGMLKVENSDEIPGAESPKPTASEHEEKFAFNFVHRHRRPPTDPVNALLSLAYSLLSKDCTIAAAAVGFDPYVGFYHQPRFGRPALALDLMEEFRPLIAESAVLTAINNRMIQPGDFVRAGAAVNLTPAGRKKFFLAYEQRQNSLLTHPLFDYKVSYRRALELQARILAKTLTGEIPEYQPLMTR